MRCSERSFGAAVSWLSARMSARGGLGLAVLLAISLAGCSSAPKKAADSAPAPAPGTTATATAPAPSSSNVPKLLPSLPDLLQIGDVAAKEGAHERARIAFRDAARAYPTSPVPWSRLAIDYFEAEDYGNAILAAQEVLQRNPQDRAAHGIAAVGGLRVSAASLKALREQQKEVPSDTKAEASKLTQTLREVLGEPVLVPQDVSSPAAAAADAPPLQKSRAPLRRPTAVRPSPARPPASTAPATPAPASPKPGNPLDRFK